jgi:hypothetical protein
MIRGLLFAGLLALTACDGDIEYRNLSEAQALEIGLIVERNLSPDSVVSAQNVQTFYSKMRNLDGSPTAPRGSFTVQLKVDNDARRSLYVEMIETVHAPGAFARSTEPMVTETRTHRLDWKKSQSYNRGASVRSIFHKSNGPWVIITSSAANGVRVEVSGGAGGFNEIMRVPADNPFSQEFLAAMNEITALHGASR